MCQRRCGGGTRRIWNTQRHPRGFYRVSNDANCTVHNGPTLSPRPLSPPPVILSIPRGRRSDVEPLNNFATIVYPIPFDQVNNGVFLSPQLVIVDHFDYFNSKTDELKVDRADWENRGRGEDRVG